VNETAFRVLLLYKFTDLLYQTD